jgi:hypothetical protein
VVALFFFSILGFPFFFFGTLVTLAFLLFFAPLGFLFVRRHKRIVVAVSIVLGVLLVLLLLL